MGKGVAVVIPVRQMGRVFERRYQCDWCEAVRECPPERRTDYRARVFFTMFDPAPHQCPDHEPVWYKGIEGVRP